MSVAEVYFWIYVAVLGVVAMLLIAKCFTKPR